MHENVQQLNEYFTTLSHKINEESCDYVISVKAYSTGVIEKHKRTAAEIVDIALPVKVELESTASSQINDVINSIEMGFNYKESITNIAPYIGTTDHQKQIAKTLTFFKAMTNHHTYVHRFEFSNRTNDIYPIFSPIMWGYSYIIGFQDSAIVLLGAGSD
jgi:hypothetical protein